MKAFQLGVIIQLNYYCVNYRFIIRHITNQNLSATQRSCSIISYNETQRWYYNEVIPIWFNPMFRLIPWYWIPAREFLKTTVGWNAICALFPRYMKHRDFLNWYFIDNRAIWYLFFVYCIPDLSATIPMCIFKASPAYITSTACLIAELI